jgi:hypothetical protein
MKRRKPGRPVSTGSKATPVVSFRLGRSDYEALERAAKAGKRTPNQQAKAALLGFLYLRP